MSFVWIGYGLTWLALALYAWRLETRRKRAERELSFHRGEGRGGSGGVGGGDGGRPPSAAGEA